MTYLRNLWKDEQGQDLIEYSLLARAKEQGLRELNLGGVPADAEREGHPQHGLFEFKRGFGGRPWLRTAAALELE